MEESSDWQTSSLDFESKIVTKNIAWLRFLKLIPHRKIYFHATKKLNIEKDLLPLFPTTKLTFGPNAKGPSIEWHMKFLREILSMMPTSPVTWKHTYIDVYGDHHKQKSMQNVHKVLHIRYFIVKMSSRDSCTVLHKSYTLWCAQAISWTEVARFILFRGLGLRQTASLIRRLPWITALPLRHLLQTSNIYHSQ